MKKLIGFAVVLLAMSACWIGCAPTSETGNELATTKRFEKMMQKPDAVVLDVRTPEEYKAGHLKNARLLDFNSGAFDSSYQQLDRSKTYLVYCRSGKRSDKAASKMAAAGFKNVVQLKGGIESWEGEIEKE